jgi:hypothetical protein
MFLDAQWTAGASPTDGRHPGRRGDGNLLDRKMNYPEPVERCARDGAAERLEHARRSE